MSQSIYSGEVFLTGRIVVRVRKQADGSPVADEPILFKADGFS